MIIDDDFIIVYENYKSRRRHYRSLCDICNKDRGYQRKSRAQRSYCKCCASKVTHAGKAVSQSTRDKMMGKYL